MKISKDSQHLQIVISRFSLNLFFLIPALLIGSFGIIPVLWLWPRFNWFVPVLLCVELCLLILVYFASTETKTYIDADANLLTIKHNPNSKLGQTELQSQTLNLIYYEPSRFSFRLNKPKTNEIMITIHKIYAVTEKFEKVELLSSVASKEEALTIVREINQFLKLEDKLVKIEKKVSSTF